MANCLVSVASNGHDHIDRGCQRYGLSRVKEIREEPSVQVWSGLVDVAEPVDQAGVKQIEDEQDGVDQGQVG